MSRRLARETALQVLFQLDMARESFDVEATVKQWAAEFAVPDTSIPFARELVVGTLAHKQEIDGMISSLAEGWALDRMAGVDRNILRLAVFEILYRPDIPGRVTINEAVEIAKRYGSEESGKFVNGILDRVVQRVGKAEGKE